MTFPIYPSVSSHCLFQINFDSVYSKTLMLSLQILLTIAAECICLFHFSDSKRQSSSDGMPCCSHQSGKNTKSQAADGFGYFLFCHVFIILITGWVFLNKQECGYILFIIFSILCFSTGSSFSTSSQTRSQSTTEY